MFVGHYAVAFAARTVPKSPNLAICFVAVQLVDIGFFSLAYFGIEKWRPDPAITGIMPVDLYFMPYTHSLAGSAAWALAAGALVAAIVARDRKLIAGAVVAALVFSHWLLDLVVHRPDLGIFDDEPVKLGFGLWDWPRIEMPLEIGLLLGGFWLYMRATRARTGWGRWSPWLLLGYLLVIQSINWFSAPPQGAAAFSGLGLLAYAASAAFAYWVERTRADRLGWE